MLKHYFKIALRNIWHYRVQNAISIVAMALSLTLFALILSLNERYSQGTPVLKTDHAHRAVMVSTSDYGSYLTEYDLDLIFSHNFQHASKSFGDVPINTYGAFITATEGSDSVSTLAYLNFVHPQLLGWLGYRSAVTGKPLPTIGEDEIILYKYQAEQLFGDRNPIGEFVDVKFRSTLPEHLNRSYRVADVQEEVSLADNLRSMVENAALAATEHTPKFGAYTIYFELKDGSSIKDLKDELKELFPTKDLRVERIVDKFEYTEKIIDNVRRGILAFLALFLIIVQWGFLRQQSQLMLLRQRELALRTATGAKRSQLFGMLLLEIFIILVITVALSLVLSNFIRFILLRDYYPILNHLRWNVEGINPVTLVTFAAMCLLDIVICLIVIQKIRLNQTGLALRMRPPTKHRLGNVGITLQLIVSILFIWVTLLFFISPARIPTNIPEDDTVFRNSIYLETPGLSVEQTQKLMAELQSTPSIDLVLGDNKLFEALPLEDGTYLPFYILTQHESEQVDFLGLEIEDKRQVSTPGRSVSVSYELKEALEEKGVWNGKTVEIMGTVYEIDGFFDHLPFEYNKKALILTDKDQPEFQYQQYIIVPKEGKSTQAKAAVDQVLQSIAPGRIDIRQVNLYNHYALDQLPVDALFFVLAILALVSIATTVATIYSNVSLHTRSRRKEMALRKINGAKSTDIRNIFLRSYIVILSVSALVTFSLVLIVLNLGFPTKLISESTAVTLYFITLAFIMAVVSLTIWWSIRKVMRIDPVTYLKE